MITSFLYIFALAFQIAGAILLIIKYWGKTKQRIIDVYFPGSGIANNDGNDNAVLDLNRTRICAVEIYNNRMAFIYITLGYILSIFGEKQLDSFITLIAVLLASTILIVLEKLIAKLIAYNKYTEEIKISYKELPNHIPCTMSAKDVDDLFK